MNINKKRSSFKNNHVHKNGDVLGSVNWNLFLVKKKWKIFNTKILSLTTWEPFSDADTFYIFNIKFSKYLI